MRKIRTWKPERLFVDNFRDLIPKKIEFFEAICALCGSTRGCALGFKHSFADAEIWEKICLLYELFLGAALRGAFLVDGNIANYPPTAFDVRPKIEGRLKCMVRFIDLVHYALSEKILLPLELQTATGIYQTLSDFPGIHVSISRDLRSTGGKCLVSGATFPLDYVVQIGVLTKRDHALISAQASADVLRYLTPLIEKKVLKTKIKQLPVIGLIVKDFSGEHTVRDWLKPITPDETRRGRPSNNKSIGTERKHIELILDQTPKFPSLHAKEIVRYLACLKTAVVAIAATLANETAFSVEEILAHELIQRLFDSISVTSNLVEKKWKWARSWIREAVEQVRKN